MDAPVKQELYLSVVVPTYNRKELLRVTLDALAKQSYPAGQVELIVVSDGSTDGTDEAVAEYAATAPFLVQLIRQVNSGVAQARNRGAQQATGEVLIFLDDDIEVVQEFLAAHASQHSECDRAAVVGCIVPDPQRRHAEPPWVAWEHAMLERNYQRWQKGHRLRPGPDHFYTGNASVRRTHFLEAGGFDVSLKRQEDTELAYRLQRTCGVQFVFEAGAVGVHRPERSWASWLNMAYGYGRLDAECARSGRVPWRRVRDFYAGCSLPTRWLGHVALRCPIAARPLRRLLLAAATASFRMRLSRPSLAALSVVYNLGYLEGVRVELGSWTQMRWLLTGKDSECSDDQTDSVACLCGRQYVGRYSSAEPFAQKANNGQH